MAQESDINSVKSITSEVLGAKRSANSVELSPRSKRQKGNNNPVTSNALQQTAREGPDPFYQRKGIFRFRDLPGGKCPSTVFTPAYLLTTMPPELRNQIYAYAVEYAYRCFPGTYPKSTISKYTSRPRTSRGAGHTRTKRTLPSRPLPCLALTQVCSSIRQEFRPMWLSTNRFPIFALEGYLKAFYPITPRKPDFKARFEKNMDPTGNLRVYVGRDGIQSIDVLRLLKHKLRFPEFKITPVSCPMFTDEVTIEALTILINNANPRWLKLIRSHVIKQVRVVLEYSQYAGMLHVVVAERGSEPCMKQVVLDNGAEEQCVRIQGELGLGDLPWNVSFGVDYA